MNALIDSIAAMMGRLMREVIPITTLPIPISDPNCPGGKVA